MIITDEEIRQEARACDARKLAQAMRMTPAERFFAGAELFEYACEITLAGIRAQHPDRSEEEHRQELRQRIRMTK
jgi:hypothetical protein